jgi:hypothetical protein
MRFASTFLFAAFLFCSSPRSTAADKPVAAWSAFSPIEADTKKGVFIETIYLVNNTEKTIKLNMPAFSLPGNKSRPARNVGPLGILELEPGDAVRFTANTVPLAAKGDLLESISIEGVAEEIPIKQHFVKASYWLVHLLFARA